MAAIILHGPAASHKVRKTRLCFGLRLQDVRVAFAEAARRPVRGLMNPTLSALESPVAARARPPGSVAAANAVSRAWSVASDGMEAASGSLHQRLQPMPPRPQDPPQMRPIVKC